MTLRATLPDVPPPTTISTSHPPVLIIEPATVIDVHDGDSFHVGLAMHALLPGAKPGWSEDVRLAHVNAPELSTPLGHGAREAVRGWILDHALAPTSHGFRLHVWGRDKYGRLLADLEDKRTGEMLSAFVVGLEGSALMGVRSQLSKADLEVQRGKART